jgi:hypothetical protein
LSAVPIDFTLHGQPAKSRAERIRDLFTGGSTAELAHICIEAGLWTDDEMKRFQFRAAQNECRAALKEKDSSGLPFAGQTTTRDDEGATIWRTRNLWAYDDYEINVKELVLQRDECQVMALALVKECSTRFGRSPSLFSTFTSPDVAADDDD